MSQYKRAVKMGVPDAVQRERERERSGALLIRDRHGLERCRSLQRTTSCCAAPGHAIG
jgi:hypothetical protein